MVVNLRAREKSVQNRPKWIVLIIKAVSLAATHNATASPQCPNLSGNYVIQGEDGQVQIAINQHDCDRIDIVRKSNYLRTIASEKHTLKLDGKDQKDSPWMGSSEQYRTSAKFVGSELQVKAISRNDSTITMIYSLNPARDLLEEALTDGRGVPVLAKRQK
jgi:hypothetical protein